MRSIVALYRICLVVSVTIFASLSFAAGVRPPAFASACIPSTPSSQATAIPIPPPATVNLFINEVLTYPQKSSYGCLVSTNDTTLYPWIEFYNASKQPQSLFKDTLVIQYNKTSISYPISPLEVPAQGFAVLFLYPSIVSLSHVAVTLRLVTITNQELDAVSVPILKHDTSFSRIPDGSANWQVTTIPTVGSKNTVPTSTGGKTTQKTGTKKTPKGKSSHLTANNGHGASVSGSVQTNEGTIGATATNSTSGVSTSYAQPRWSGLRFPGSETVPTSATVPAPLSTSGTPPVTSASVAMDVPKKIVLSCCIVALFGVLYWAWRLFFRTRGVTTIDDRT